MKARAMDWAAFAREVSEAVGALELEHAAPTDVVLVSGPRPPPLPSRRPTRSPPPPPPTAPEPDGVLEILPGAAGPALSPAGARARRREPSPRRREWSVPSVGELEARQVAAGAEPRAQLLEAPAPYVDWHGRQRNLPADPDTQPTVGLRAALLREHRRWDNEDGPGEGPAAATRPHLRPREATVRVKASGGRPTLSAQWAEVDAWRARALTPHQAQVEARREEQCFREWARRRGFKVSHRKKEGGAWLAVPNTEEAFQLARVDALKADTFAELRNRLHLLCGPPAPRPAAAPRRQPKSKPQPVSAQLALGMEGA